MICFSVPRGGGGSSKHKSNAPTTRPRPQPITGTPPPDLNDKCDSKV